MNTMTTFTYLLDLEKSIDPGMENKINEEKKENESEENVMKDINMIVIKKYV